MQLILRLIFILISFVIFCGHTNGGNYKPIVDHPRLLLYKGHESDIASSIKNIPELKNVHQKIISCCDKIVDSPCLERNLIGVRLLDVSSEALRRIFYLAYGYRMTGNKTYADRAIREILNVCNFSDWNPSHFLDISEMTMAVSIGYDWLYDEITEVDRHLISKAVMEKALIPANDNKFNYFYNTCSNWNPVCNAGILYGAIIFYDNCSSEADELIKKCLESNPKALDAYSPDGGYPEGYGYWGYGTTFQVFLIDALQTTYGTDFGLTPDNGFYDTWKYVTFMAAPSGMCFNFSDTNEESHGNIASWWFANYSSDNAILHEELKYISSSKIQIGEERLLPALLVFAARIKNFPYDFYDGKYWINHGSTPIFIYRSGWNEPTDTYLGVKGGSPATPHAHMDAGSFVYEYQGVRWAIDLGMQDYYSLEKKGVDIWNNKQNGQRWDVLRMRNDYHNTLTVNSMRHNVQSYAPFIYTFQYPHRKGAVIDLSSTLDGVTKAHREVSLNSYDHLIVLDTIHNGISPIEIKWVMVTDATPEISNDKIKLYKDGLVMNVMFQSDNSYAKIKPEIWDTTPIHEYDEPNPNKIRIGFQTKLQPMSQTTFKVNFVPDDFVK